MLPIVVGGVFLAVFLGLIVAYKIATNQAAQGIAGQPVASISCDSGEQLATHYHAHLQILYHGQPVNVPPQVGILSSCFYWLHTHDTTGVIHIEAPKSQAARQFTLRDFFRIWGQPLSSKQVATFPISGSDQLQVWVDGKPYTGDPGKIVLSSHENVVLEIGPPFTDPPPAYVWDTSTYAQ